MAVSRRGRLLANNQLFNRAHLFLPDHVKSGKKESYDCHKEC